MEKLDVLLHGLLRGWISVVCMSVGEKKLNQEPLLLELLQPLVSIHLYFRNLVLKRLIGGSQGLLFWQR